MITKNYKIKASVARNDFFGTVSTTALFERTFGPSQARICIPRANYDKELTTWNDEVYFVFRFYLDPLNESDSFVTMSKSVPYIDTSLHRMIVIIVGAVSCVITASFGIYQFVRFMQKTKQAKLSKKRKI